jgi:hypothetical protein
MTLVEVVIAFLILSVTAGLFIQGSVRQHMIMLDTRSITENVFSTAKRAELKIQEIKDALGGAPAPSPLPSPNTYTMFPGEDDERVVSYYPVMERINDIEGNPGVKTIYSVVADTRQPEFDVPVITSMTTDIKSGGVIVEGAYAAPGTTVESAAVLDRADLLLLNKYQWYISGPSFPIRWDNVSMEDPGVGINVPMYPKDFDLIPYAVSSKLTITPDMAGRHVLCIMTPAAISGKMGRSVMSKPRYIYGLPIFSDLAAHYDASLIDPPASVIDINIWPDISGNNADASHYGSYPVILSITDFPSLDGRDYPVRARQAAFDGGGWLEAPGLALSASDDFTMFAVVKADDMSSSAIISNGGAWVFDMSSYPGLLEDKWYILGLRSDNKRTVGKDAALSFDSPAGDRSTGDIIKIGGGSKISLVELIIYNTQLSDGDWEKVTQYLGDKYNID